MKQLLDVTTVRAKEDVTLELTFENGEKRVFDMKPLFEKKPFSRLKDTGIFTMARIELGTVIWPGNIDIDPELLWELSVPA